MDGRYPLKSEKFMSSAEGTMSPLEDTLLYLTEMAKGAAGVEGSGIMFFEPDSRMIALQYPALQSPRDMVSQYRVPVDEMGAAAKTFRTRRPFFTNKCSEDPEVIHKYSELYGVESLLTVPVECGAEAIGVWHLANKQGSGWEDQDINRAAAMVRQFSGLIDQARQLHIREQRHNVWLSLMEKIASSGDVQSVADVLAHVLKTPLLVVDRWGRCRASVSLMNGSLNMEGVNLKYLSRLNSSGVVKVLPSVENSFSSPAWVVPLGAFGRTSGYLLISARENNNLDEILINQAALVLAAALGNEDRLAGVIERLSSDFLDRLVGGTLAEAEAYMRAGRVGLDLRRGWTIMLAVPDWTSSANEEQKLWQRMHVARDVLWGRLEDMDRDCWLGVLGDCSMLVLVKKEPDTGTIPRELPQAINQVLRRYASDITFSIGVGDVVCKGPAHFAEAFSEARQTVEIGRKLKGYGQITFSNNLGVNMLLYEMGFSTASRAFSDRLLSGLMEYDRKHGSQLLETLEIYLEMGGNIAAAARALHTHVNTVRYRLSKVEELTGRSLKSHKNRFEFQLTLQINKLRG
ncbi:MAG: helix-turn-helix domain-containing protein [Bacillota bacterium]